jgi:hypothetical protein
MVTLHHHVTCLKALAIMCLHLVLSRTSISEFVFVVFYTKSSTNAIKDLFSVSLIELSRNDI